MKYTIASIVGASLVYLSFGSPGLAILIVAAFVPALVGDLSKERER